MQNKICVYAICRNESKFVKRWYESMKEADLVVVLDTGSTDNTVDLLEDVGVDIVESKVINPWRFDVARNESLKLVPEDYNILVCTDLDEVFEPGWAELLRNKWDDSKHERAHYRYIWRHNPDGSPDVMYHYNKIHTRDWIWRAPVHEYLTRKNNVLDCSYDNSKVLNLYNEITLHHYPDSFKSRGSYLGLLEIRAEEMKEVDPVSLIYLGREYWFYRRYQDAIDTLNMIITDYSDRFTSPFIAYTYLMIGYAYGSMYLESDSKEKETLFGKAEQSFRSGIDTDPTFMENYTGLAELFMRHNKFNIAKSIIEDGFKNSVRAYRWIEDGSNWTYKPLEILSISNYCLGNIDKAIALANKALSYKPNDESLKSNLEVMISKSSIVDLI